MIKPFLQWCLLTAACTSAALANDTLSVDAAFERATQAELILIDIRAPREWQATGIPAPARPLSMYDRDFLTKLSEIISATDGRPVAFICATGKRSAWLARELSARGIPGLIDVPEGLLGSAAGPGWLRRDLPLRVHDSPGARQAPTYSLWERLSGAYRPPWLGD